VLYTAAGLIVLILGFIIGSVLIRGLPVLSWHFLTARSSDLHTGGGISMQIFNTIYILILSMLIALPIGLGAGIHLAEYAKPGRLTSAVRLATESLASVPSIVFGLFGMILFVNTAHLGFSRLGGAATLAILNLPLIVRVTEEALRSVPDDLRHASLALGATKEETIFNAVLPAAVGRLATGAILAAGRALGESAVLIATAGMSSPRYLTLDPLASGETLAVHLWYVNAENSLSDAARIADGTAAFLILAMLVISLGIGWLAGRLNKRLAGEG
jgi:phosphate transport system permease protein